jgi:hypothetical protein
MKPLVRTLAPAVAVLVALGVAAPAASAKPAHDKAVHVKVRTDKPAKAKAVKAKAGKVKIDRQQAAAHKLAAASQRLARAAERKAAAVERSMKESRLAGLDEAAATAVVENATADAAALRLLAGEARAADATTIGGVSDRVAAYRGEFYVVLVNRLRYAAALRALAGDDATVVAAVDALVAPALELHADAGKSQLRDLHERLAALTEALETDDGTEDELPAAV